MTERADVAVVFSDMLCVRCSIKTGKVSTGESVGGATKVKVRETRCHVLALKVTVRRSTC